MAHCRFLRRPFGDRIACLARRVGTDEYAWYVVLEIGGCPSDVFLRWVFVMRQQSDKRVGRREIVLLIPLWSVSFLLMAIPDAYWDIWLMGVFYVYMSLLCALWVIRRLPPSWMFVLMITVGSFCAGAAGLALRGILVLIGLA